MRSPSGDLQTVGHGLSMASPVPNLKFEGRCLQRTGAGPFGSTEHRLALAPCATSAAQVVQSGWTEEILVRSRSNECRDTSDLHERVLKRSNHLRSVIFPV